MRLSRYHGQLCTVAQSTFARSVLAQCITSIASSNSDDRSASHARGSPRKFQFHATEWLEVFTDEAGKILRFSFRGDRLT